MRLLDIGVGEKGRLAIYAVALFAVCLAFQGSRGLFEPDEGRHVNAALEMLRTGNGWIPTLHGMIFLDKPPVVYWSIAAGIKALGTNEWGARLGHALALAATGLLVARWSARAWGETLGKLAGMAYVTSLLPLLAANILTPDALLALWTTAASLAYWQHRNAESAASRWCWALALGSFAGLGLLTKGAATLIFLAPMAVHALWDKRIGRLLRRPEIWVGAAVAIFLGCAWYVQVDRLLPGAMEYFFDNQVAGRLWDDSYNRNPEWWKPFYVYGGVLLLGSLPWSLTWPGLLLKNEPRGRLRALAGDPLGRYLLLSVAVPLIVLSLASSRLPLYILPLFPHLLMLTIAFGRGLQRHPVTVRRVLVAVVAMIALRAIGAMVPVDRDSRALGAELRNAGVRDDECILATGIKVHGLGLYGFSRVSWHTMRPEFYPYFEPPRTLKQDLPAKRAECGDPLRLLVETKHRVAADDTVTSLQLECDDRVLSERAMLLTCGSAVPR